MIVATPARHSQSKEILAGGSTGGAGELPDAEWKRLETLIDTKMRVGVRYTDHGDAEDSLTRRLYA
jgi:hypothetical protein